VSLTPVVRRARAGQDLLEAVEYYLQEAGDKVALRFIDAVEKAFRRIVRHPPSGSPRYSLELELPGLRCWPVKHFPYLVFYVEREDHVDVWRLLHGQPDIPEGLICDATEGRPGS